MPESHQIVNIRFLLKSVCICIITYQEITCTHWFFCHYFEYQTSVGSSLCGYLHWTRNLHTGSLSTYYHLRLSTTLVIRPSLSI